jgi:hypothetical protein
LTRKLRHAFAALLGLILAAPLYAAIDVTEAETTGQSVDDTGFIEYTVDVVSGDLVVYCGWRWSGLGDEVQSGHVARVSGATVDGFTFDETLELNLVSVGLWSTIATSTGSLVFRHTTGSRIRGGVIVVSGSWDGSRVEDVTEGSGTSVGMTASAGSLTSAGAALFVGCLVNDDSAVGGAITEDAAFTSIYENSPSSAGGAGSGIYQVVGGATTDTPEWAFDGNGDWAAIGAVYKEAAGGSPTREQEGFRWGVDDGNEAAHTFEAAQDTNISIADTQSRLLRALVNATGDPATAAYTLRYQKNGAGGYAAVPVGSTTPGSISNQNVAASADDAQQIGSTMTINGTTIGGSLDATSDWAAMRFTSIAIPVGATITSATVGVVPSATGEDEPLVTVYMEAADDCATFTTTNNDISNRSRTTGVSWSSADLGANGSTYFSSPSLVSDFQAVVNRGGWASGNDVCVIIQGGATATRDLTIEAQDLGPNTNPPRLSVAWTIPNEIYINTSANITASGEATTFRLTAPAGKATSDFVTGRRWDDENGTDSIDITTDDYTEVEWLVALSATPAISDYFEFRVYAAAAALDTYTVTPRWTIPGAGGSILPHVIQQH